MKEKLRLAHISDLHFSSGTVRGHSHIHSIRHLIGLQERFESEGPFDRVIVSGDLSNNGDDESLQRSYDFLFADIGIGEAKRTGLRLDPRTTTIVPGNHDAFNAPNHGMRSRLSVLQESVRNYNYIFSDHSFRAEDKIFYEWIPLADSGVLCMALNSSYLGDPEIEKQHPRGNYLSRVARGKLTIAQSEMLLSLIDMGMRGELPRIQGQPGEVIASDLFARSLRILTMHHYLFEPPGYTDDFFLQVQDRDVAIKNIAMADFDILLCGHKHVADFHAHTCRDFFADFRSRGRYLLNHFRRLLGLNMIPIQLRDNRGRFLGKLQTLLVNMLILRQKEHSSNPEEILERTSEILDELLEDPEALGKEIRRFMLEHGEKGTHIVEDGEFRELRREIANRITKEQREALKEKSKQLRRYIRDVGGRSLLQIMAGSAVKAECETSKRRSFNSYEISRGDGRFDLEARRYVWHESEGAFSMKPDEFFHTFRDSRLAGLG